MIVTDVHPASPLFGQVRRGFKLIAVNGEPVTDSLDYRYKTAEESVRLEFEDKAGRRHNFQFPAEPFMDFGLDFAEDKIMRCNSNCIFCFVHQQPKGMRRSLYVKDDDYRLSFTHGSFITLSNLTETDIERIITQRLSPLYVSVHATDDTLRRCIFRNEKLPSVMALLTRLIDHGITFHSQVVVCPGINDGEQLDRTIDDLFRLYPGVQTVGVVPVGLTRYRQRLPKLQPFTAETAVGMLDYIGAKQKACLEKEGIRFVFAADEFYVMAGRELPKLSEYEEMAQFENGIGMLRWSLTQFNRRRRHLRGLSSPKRIAMLTGKSAYKFISRDIISYIRDKAKVMVDVIGVENAFWGPLVTVSGLLTGQDLLQAALQIRDRYDTLLLPPNCLNGDDLFLDNMSLDEFKKQAGIDIHIGSYLFADTIREVLA